MTNESGFADQTLSKRKGATFNVAPVRRPRKRSVVYFVAAANGIIKIGTTGYLDQRMKILRGQSPLPLELLVVTPGKRADEFAYHARFAAHRLHGEWFARCPEIEAEIARLSPNPLTEEV